MKVLTVIGNRPQFVKAAAVSPLLRRDDEEILVHTGQHFDDRLSAIFFSELGLPAPDRELGVALGSASSQTARMLDALEPVLREVAPDLVLVYGDTNSTLAGALCAAQCGVPVAHVEAGMRSYDMTMPEELNRVLCDHAASLLLCSSAGAAENLSREGIGSPPTRVEVVGDVMVDVALAIQPRARERLDLVRARGVEPGEYLLATAHRAGNVDTPARLGELVELLCSVGASVLLALHPRTAARLEEFGLRRRLEACASVSICEPLGYVELTALLCNARAVLTDSGGLQKEAYLARVPCLTMRDRTEWIETVQTGWNTLVGLDPEAVRDALAAPAPVAHPPLYGDGDAGRRVLAALGAFTG
ncbi:MAG TPA: UDP-N-acetylglucosamine 2-epimerase (non-hydrolyzing) [Solirubrobacteraceae bacterium]|nr:UDP-N-acetylglucosamine 2-epimerase (non-hydrolyzing) [Solirubrobacteraceae bacterium]